MRPYIAIVSKEPESAYGIFFPDAPGCFSAADDLAELFAQATEALTSWSEVMRANGLRVPAVRDLSTLRNDPALAAAFAEADLVIAIPAPGDAGFDRAA